jgi:hypothetical protein
MASLISKNFANTFSASSIHRFPINSLFQAPTPEMIAQHAATTATACAIVAMSVTSSPYKG